MIKIQVSSIQSNEIVSDTADDYRLIIYCGRIFLFCVFLNFLSENVIIKIQVSSIQSNEIVSDTADDYRLIIYCGKIFLFLCVFKLSQRECQNKHSLFGFCVLPIQYSTNLMRIINFPRLLYLSLFYNL